MKIAPLLTVIAVIFVSCKEYQSQNKDTHITTIFNDNIETINNSYYLEDITINWNAMYLDNSSIDAMVGYIEEIHYDDSLFFVSHKLSLFGEEKKIYVFDKNGKFVRQISNIGRAKNEYISLGEWTLDTYNKEIIIFDRFDCVIKRYSYKGDFIGSNQLDYSLQQISGITALNDYKYLFQMSIIEEPSLDYYLYDIEKNKVCGIFPIRNIYTKGHNMSGNQSYSDLNNPSKFFIRYYDDIIYNIDSIGNTKAYIKLGFVPQIKKKDLKALPPEIDKCPMNHVFSLFDLTDYILLNTFSGYYLINKHTNKATQYVSDGVVNINKIPSTTSIIGVFGNYLIGVITPDAAESRAKHKRETQTEEVIEFYKKAAANENATLVFYEIGK